MLLLDYTDQGGRCLKYLTYCGIGLHCIRAAVH